MAPTKRLVKRARTWMEEHPLQGWYLAVFGLINITLNLLDLFV